MSRFIVTNEIVIVYVVIKLLNLRNYKVEDDWFPDLCTY